MTEDVSACLRTLPRKIKLGAYDWTVSLEEGIHDKCGEADFEPQVIRLWPESLTSAGHVVGILLHECLHVLYDIAGLAKARGSKDDREETIVMGFEQGLISLFRDNPKLLTWIKKGLK